MEGIYVSEEALKAKFEEEKAMRRALHAERLLSPQVRDTPFGQFLAKASAGNLEYLPELTAFVEEQWIAYQAADELKLSTAHVKRGREEEEEKVDESTPSPNATEDA